MEKTLGREYPEGKERVKFLKDNCDEVVEKGYSKRFTPEQISTMKDLLSENAIQINDIEEEKKAVTETFSAQLKPLKKEKQSILMKIKNKAEFVNEQCYKFIDQQEKLTLFYNQDGDLIDFRPCNPDELQGTIFQVQRTGTED